jgi:hypothetical protein
MATLPAIALRGKPGSIVRVYGFPGLFRLAHTSRTPWDWLAWPIGAEPFNGFGVSDKSLVEVDGNPCPLQSCPLAPPAPDYPHAPTYDYDDGPADCATWALKQWHADEEL